MDFGKKNAPKKSTKKSPAKCTRNSGCVRRNFLGFRQKPFLLKISWTMVIVSEYLCHGFRFNGNRKPLPTPQVPSKTILSLHALPLCKWTDIKVLSLRHEKRAQTQTFESGYFPVGYLPRERVGAEL